MCCKCFRWGGLSNLLVILHVLYVVTLVVDLSCVRSEVKGQVMQAGVDQY